MGSPADLNPLGMSFFLRPNLSISGSRGQTSAAQPCSFRGKLRKERAWSCPVTRSGRILVQRYLIAPDKMASLRAALF